MVGYEGPRDAAGVGYIAVVERTVGNTAVVVVVAGEDER